MAIEKNSGGPDDFYDKVETAGKISITEGSAEKSQFGFLNTVAETVSVNVLFFGYWQVRV